jgi:hypothetical protein
MKMKYLFCHLFILLEINQSLNAQIYFSNRYDFLQNATPSYSRDIIRDSY